MKDLHPATNYSYFTWSCPFYILSTYFSSLLVSYWQS